MDSTLIIILVIVVLIAISVAGIYNKLVRKRNFAKTQWAQIEVQLKRRADLIPNVVNTVKGYAAHESETLEAVIQARNSFVNAGSINEEIETGNQMTAALGKLFALSEAYPDLKANENFKSLQNELSETEDKISIARQFYNDAVLTYNNAVQTVPSNIIAGMFGFTTMKQLEATEAEKVVPKVEF